MTKSGPDTTGYLAPAQAGDTIEIDPDPCPICGTLELAKRKRKPKSLSDQLRAIIAASELSRYEIAKRSGVDASQLHRFIYGQGRLTTDSLDAIGSVPSRMS